MRLVIVFRGVVLGSVSVDEGERAKPPNPALVPLVPHGFQFELDFRTVEQVELAEAGPEGISQG